MSNQKVFFQKVQSKLAFNYCCSALTSKLNSANLPSISARGVGADSHALRAMAKFGDYEILTKGRPSNELCHFVKSYLFSSSEKTSEFIHYFAQLRTVIALF